MGIMQKHICVILLACVPFLMSAASVTAIPQPLVDAVTAAVQKGTALPKALLATDAEVGYLEESLAPYRKAGAIEMATAQPVMSAAFKHEALVTTGDRIGLIAYQVQWSKGRNVIFVTLELQGRGSDQKIVAVDNAELFHSLGSEKDRKPSASLLTFVDLHGETIARGSLDADWSAIRPVLLPSDDIIAQAITEDEGLKKGSLPAGIATDLMAGFLAEAWLEKQMDLDITSRADGIFAGSIVSPEDDFQASTVTMLLFIPKAFDDGSPGIFEAQLETTRHGENFIITDIELNIDGF